MMLIDSLFKLFRKDNNNILDSEHNINQDSYSNLYYFNTDFFKDNPSLVSVYKKFLLTLGKCPMCNSYLFLELVGKHIDGSYSAFSVCTNHHCGYKVDVSRGFNDALGIKSNIDYEGSVDNGVKGLERLSDCNVKLVSVPRVTGFLDCSFRDALGRKCDDFEGFVEK